MKRSGVRFQKISACRVPLAAVATVLILSACGKDEPFPPHSPPRPVTDDGGGRVTLLELTARPVVPPPGAM